MNTKKDLKTKPRTLALVEYKYNKPDMDKIWSCGLCRNPIKQNFKKGQKRYMGLFTLGAFHSIVCDECGKKYSPELYRLLKIYRLLSEELESKEAAQFGAFASIK